MSMLLPGYCLTPMQYHVGNSTPGTLAALSTEPPAKTVQVAAHQLAQKRKSVQFLREARKAQLRFPCGFYRSCLELGLRQMRPQALEGSP